MSPLTPAISCATIISKIALERRNHIHLTVSLVSRHDCRHVDATGLCGFACLEGATRLFSWRPPRHHQSLSPSFIKCCRCREEQSPRQLPLSTYLSTSSSSQLHFLASSALVGALPSTAPRRTWTAPISKIWRLVPMQWESQRGINGGRKTFPSLPCALLTASTQQKSSRNQINLCDTACAQDVAIFKIG